MRGPQEGRAREPARPDPGPERARRSPARATWLAAILTVSLGVGPLARGEAGGARAPVLARAAGAHVVDAAGLLAAPARARIERLLGALRRDADVELVVATVPGLGGATIAGVADRLLEEWGVGRQTRGDRGLLLVIAPAEAETRLAVSYALEGVLPDALVSYVQREQMAPFFRQGRVGEGIEATVELLVTRTVEEIGRRAGAAGAGPPAGFRGGGAGAAASAPIGGGLPAPSAAADAARFGPQPTPELAWARFLEVHRRGIRDPALGLYDAEARARLRARPHTDAGLRHVAELYAGRSPVIRARGDRAAVVFLDDPDHRLAPWFFRRTPEGWRLDGGMYPGVIAYNHLNQWRFARRDHPYAFAFEDFRIDARGFATPPAR
jgi:uncharacterized protein